MYRPEIKSIENGQIVKVQGHPARAEDVRIDASRTDAQRITFAARFLDVPENRELLGSGYDGAIYSLYSVAV